MFKKSIFSILFTFVLFFQGCNEKKSSQTQEINDMISTKEYVLTDLNAAQYKIKRISDGFTLENATTKVIIFDIFATWCPPCQASASHLSSLQKKYKNDLVIIGVTIEDDISNAKLQEFSKNYDATYTLVNSPQNRELVDAIAASLKLGDRFPIPLMAMYKDGKLVNHYVGAVLEEFVESDIKKALGR